MGPKSVFHFLTCTCLEVWTCTCLSACTCSCRCTCKRTYTLMYTHTYIYIFMIDDIEYALFQPFGCGQKKKLIIFGVKIFGVEFWSA